jgi:hypothetical protein
MDINSIKLVDLAKVASKRFLQENVSLNDAIAKIAEEEELSPMQIRRVAEYANHDSNLSLHKSADDKTFTFELADPEVIIQTLQGEKTAGVAVLDVLSAAKSAPSFLEKTAGEQEPAPSLTFDPDPDVMECRSRNVGILLEKLAGHAKAMRKDLLMKVASHRADIAGVMDEIADMAKEHILVGRGKFSDMFKFACSRDPESAGLFKIAFEHIKKDMIEKLGAPVDTELLSDNLEIPDGTLEVLNGEHTLAVQLDTLKNKISDEDRDARRIKLVDTFGTAIIDQMDVLKTPEDVEKSLEESLDNLSKRAEAGIDEFVEFLEKDALGLPAKAMLLLGAGLGLKGLSDVTRETTKGAVKESAKERDERKRLEQLAVKRRLY